MRTFNITVNGKGYNVQVEELTAGAAAATPVAAAPVAAAPAPVPAAPAPAASATAPAAAGSVTVESPMPGTVLDIKVTAGQQVEQNQVVLILEAMKMENEIVAPSGGTVASINVSKGDSVETGTVLLTLS